MEKKFEKQSFKKRLKSMCKVDVRRTFTSPLFYIMVGIAFIVPILILVMTTMMDGMTTTNPQTNEVTVIEGFDNVWQIFGSVSGADAMMSMDLVSMCNINMIYFAIAVFVCLFVSEDFRSGYAKNLFTVRSGKLDYVCSKTLVGFICSAAMFLAFFVGALLGGGIASLPFTMDGFTEGNLVACILSKIFISLIYVGICVFAGVIGKQRAWLSMIVALGIGMLFFTMIPMVTPLDSTFIHVILCFVGGVLFSFGLGFGSNLVLKKTSLV